MSISKRFSPQRLSGLNYFLPTLNMSTKSATPEEIFRLLARHCYIKASEITKKNSSVITVGVMIQFEGLCVYVLAAMVMPACPEILYQRDYHTAEHLNIVDEHLGAQHLELHEKNHLFPAPKGGIASRSHINLGDLIFVRSDHTYRRRCASDGNKNSIRDVYIVIGEFRQLTVKKLHGNQFRNALFKHQYDEVYRSKVTILSNGLIYSSDVYAHVPSDAYRLAPVNCYS
jgi:hypothetical protein